MWLLGKRLLVLGAAPPGHSHDHEHDHHGHEHHHDHDHEHHHSHEPPTSWRSLLALGVSGGLLPCPEALMVLLISIAAHQVLFGLLLIVAFSTGLAGVLVSFGLVLVYARGLFSRLDLSKAGVLQRLVPVGSAMVIVVAGLAITAQAVPQVV